MIAKLILLVASMGMAGLSGIDAASPPCGRMEEFDFSGMEPLPFGGEVIGIGVAGGEIVNTRVEVRFTTAGAFNAGDLGVTLVLPVLETSRGAPHGAVSFSGLQLGWSGQGTFDAAFETDSLNGMIDFQGNPFYTWFLVTDNFNPGGGPAQGVFERLAFSFDFLPCRLGDMNCDGLVNVDDVEPFALAICDPDAYEVAYPLCHADRGEVNQDGDFDGRDAAGFVAILLANN